MEQNNILIYNKTKLSLNSILSFEKKERSKNDENNKVRESIIGAIINKEIPNFFYDKSDKWKSLKEEIDIFTKKIIYKSIGDVDIEKLECIHKGGRMFNYDYELMVNDKYNLKIEFKYNCLSVKEHPQFSSPMKPSKYLSVNFEEFWYKNILPDIVDIGGFDLPDIDDYFKDIHNNKPKCIKNLQLKYYQGCERSSKFTNKKEDIDFYESCRKLDKVGIELFINYTDLDIKKLSKYLKNSQSDKIYMCFKDGKFYYDKINDELYQINKVIKKNKNSFICETSNGDKINVMIRFKNGCGLAYPAFQISSLK